MFELYGKSKIRKGFIPPNRTEIRSKLFCNRSELEIGFQIYLTFKNSATGEGYICSNSLGSSSRYCLFEFQFPNFGFPNIVQLNLSTFWILAHQILGVSFFFWHSNYAIVWTITTDDSQMIHIFIVNPFWVVNLIRTNVNSPNSLKIWSLK